MTLQTICIREITFTNVCSDISDVALKRGLALAEAKLGFKFQELYGEKCVQHIKYENLQKLNDTFVELLDSRADLIEDYTFVVNGGYLLHYDDNWLSLLRDYISIGLGREITLHQEYTNKVPLFNM